ncbi:MAG: Fe-S oxidoreductase [bacterium]|nr:MAG: Fe-S oxidoreductase [bacterium]
MSEIVPIYHGRRNFLGSEDLVISFYTEKCQYRCSFCGLPERSSNRPVNPQRIRDQVDTVFDIYTDWLPTFGQLSVGNEGSILDGKRFPPEAFDYLIDKSRIMPSLRVLSLETRPEYAREDRLREIMDSSTAEKLDLTVGFETLDDDLRNRVLNKHMSRQLFEDVIKLLGKIGARLTSYVMLKPGPNMTDEEGIKEAVQTAQYIGEKCSKENTECVIYLNPTYVARDSRLAHQMKETGYRPPKIHDVMRTVIGIKNLGLPVYVGLSSEGLSIADGDVRSSEGFDRKAKRAVKKFNRDQDVSIFQGILRV